MEPKVIGYGPKSDIFPYIPEFLIIDSHGSNHKLTNTGEVESASLDEEVEAVLYPTDLKVSHWCAIEEDRTLVWFTEDDRKQWITDRAIALVREAKVNPNPLSGADMLKAAAKLCGFSLAELISTLEEHRKSSSESLEQIFKRLDLKIPNQASSANK